MDYTCQANPLYEHHWWLFPMSVQFAGVLLNEYFLQTGDLTKESNTIWSNIWDRQAISREIHAKKCPILGRVQT